MKFLNRCKPNQIKPKSIM